LGVGGQGSRKGKQRSDSRGNTKRPAKKAKRA
jgi:hypothetical protein